MIIASTDFAQKGAPQILHKAPEHKHHKELQEFYFGIWVNHISSSGTHCRDIAVNIFLHGDLPHRYGSDRWGRRREAIYAVIILPGWIGFLWDRFL